MGVDLVVSEVGEQRPVELFRRDRQHSGDAGGVFGMVQRGVLEQRVDRGEAGVAGPHAVAAVAFEMVEKRCDQRRVEDGQVQLGRGGAGLFSGEAEQ